MHLQFKDKDPQVIFERVRDHVCPFIKILGNQQKSKFAKHMKDAIFMISREYSESSYETVDYDAPAVIWSRIKALQTSTGERIQELEGTL